MTDLKFLKIYYNNKWIFNSSKIRKEFNNGSLDSILLPFADTTLSTFQKLTCIDSGINSPHCVNCGERFYKWCSNFLCASCKTTQMIARKRITMIEKYGNEHALQNKSILNKMKKTMIDKFGVDNSAKHAGLNEKRKNTNLKKYGFESASKCKSVQDKVKNTNICRFGVERPAQNKDIIKKMMQTTKEKYGVENAAQSPIVYDKIRKTNLEKYGVENPSQHEDVKRKKIETCQNNFGVDYGTQSPIVYDKIRKTNLEKYGVENPSQHDGIKRKIQNTHHLNFINTLSENYLDVLNEKYKEYCENKFSFLWLSHQTQIPPNGLRSLMKRYNLEIKNHPIKVSSEEYDLFKHVSSFYDGKITQSDRKQLSGKEIDIWIPEKNLGIEYHGVYWHSENPISHLEKYKIAKDAGISLLQIFSSEWKYKSEIVVSLIKAKLNIFDDRVFARHTMVKEITNDEYKSFTEQNHLQGYSPAKIRVGLFIDNILISVMSFSKPRFDKNHEWEMVRYCNLLNTQIIGGASKLFKYFIKTYNPSSVITYADVRYSTGEIYNTLGFNYSHHSPPNFFYFKPYEEILESRQKYQKYKLKKLFPDLYDVTKTGEQIMLEAGYSRIYDAGNLVFTWKRP